MNGRIEFSSDSEFLEHSTLHSATTTNTEETLTHTIPGNTVHYKVTLEPVAEAKPFVCTVTVTGTQKGRFDTGYSILQELLCDQRQRLPLGQLWSGLITVACQHTGEERLKVTKLLMMMLETQTKSHAQPAGDRLDLTALKPLWQLYTTLMKQYGQ